MRIALCDDNAFFLKTLHKKINEICDKNDIDFEVYEFNCGNDLIDSFDENKYDIVFLDIDMPDITGKDVANNLRARSGNSFKLVFISDYYNEVFSTFKYNIDSFIPKNRLDTYLESEIVRIVEIVKGNESIIFSFKYCVNQEYANGNVNINDITYVEVLNREIILHTVRDKYSLCNYHYEKIKSQFMKYGFLDIHRTCIVNINYITSVKNDCVIVCNKDELPLSRRKKDSIKKAFFENIKNQVVK